MISPRLLAATRWMLLPALLASCSDEAEQSNSEPQVQQQVQQPSGNPFAAPTAEARAEKLLAFAFDAANKFPVESRVHAKNRGRAQYRVSHAAIGLGLIELAKSQVEPNEAWQKGLVLAEIALHYAEQEGDDGMDAMIERASLYADEILKNPDQQAWRRDRIRVTLARVQAALGRQEEVGPLLAGAEVAELERGRPGLALHLEDDVIGEQLSRYDELKKTGSFEGLSGAAETFIVFHERKYANSVLRERLETAVADLTQKLPVEKQFGFVMQLGENAVASGDAARAHEFVEKAEGLLQFVRPDLILSSKLEARLAEFEHSAGKTDAARARLRGAIERFDAGETAGNLIDIYMADALIPVAAAHWKMGDEQRAQELYFRASEVAVLNPNSRPRCNDLVDLCISLAENGVQPSDELAQGMVRISDNLGDPW